MEGTIQAQSPRHSLKFYHFKKRGIFLSFLREVQDLLPAVKTLCSLENDGYCVTESIKLYNWRRWRVEATTQLIGGDILFVVPWNESFIWPGLYVGHKVTISLPFLKSGERIFLDRTIETVSLVPRVFTVEEFLTDEDCELIITTGKPSLFNSTVGDVGYLSQSERNSKTAWILKEEPGIDEFYFRASFLTHTPIEHQEGLQLLHYETGGHYNSHCDYFCEGECQEVASQRNRFITLLFYLNHVEEGGGTSFSRVLGPNDDDDPWKRDTQDYTCQKGIVAQPKKRRALMFYNLHPQQYRTTPRGDVYSEHIACNVTRGEKWAANFWIWNNVRFGEENPQAYVPLDDSYNIPWAFDFFDRHQDAH
eukprot:TRINITY_DN4943_c0_g1_i1.p1 TRINITY_DN4943_c0_g1~~TRINITY_DN4943_c0_g1_i1.p1  ORF type:complete len:364 (+),score=38.64 TRINITY_DN4943_c0_g1_i1:121-1212(+)